MSGKVNANWPGWETVRMIGRGSFGAVYEIRRDHFGEEESAALKVISIPQSEGDIDDLMNDGYDVSSITARYESYLKDIVGEYSMMAKMKGHSNIVYCDDLNYIKHEDGIGWDIYIKMELLTALPKALPQNISEDLVVALGRDMCKALLSCKERHVVHRDIKPQNIFVAKDGTYKLGDFGIAKTAERTTSGTKIGTYKYMAPEVYKSEPYGSAADIYSLGLVMYWLLNERRTPFLPLPPEMPTAGMEDQARTRRFGGEPLPAPAHGSPELQAIVLKACAYEPKDRFSSAEEMLEALEALSPQSTAGRTAVGATVAAGTASAFEVVQPTTEQTESTISAFGTPQEQNEMTESTISAWGNGKSQPETKTTSQKYGKKQRGIIVAIALLIALIVAIVWPKTDYYFEINSEINGQNYTYVIDSNIPNIEWAAVTWELQDISQNGTTINSIPISKLPEGAIVQHGWEYKFTIVATYEFRGTVYTDSFTQEETPVQEIVINKLPDTTEYICGQEIDLTGLEVDIHYANGETKTVSGDDPALHNEPKVLTTLGIQTISIQYGYGSTAATFDVAVKSRHNIIATHTTANIFPDSGNGINDNGQSVYWNILIELNSEAPVEDVSCSWSQNLQHTMQDYIWPHVKAGGSYWRTTGNYQSYYDLHIFLPNDKSIEGGQYIIIDGTKVSFTLKWLGDYSTGRGWDISNIQAS